MLWLPRSLFVLGFTLLLLAAAQACGTSCPSGFVEQDGQCVRGSDSTDASTLENAVETADAGTSQDAGTTKPATKSGTTTPKGGSDAAGSGGGGAGGAPPAGSGGSGGSAGAAGEPSEMMEPE